MTIYHILTKFLEIPNPPLKIVYILKCTLLVFYADPHPLDTIHNSFFFSWEPFFRHIYLVFWVLYLILIIGNITTILKTILYIFCTWARTYALWDGRLCSWMKIRHITRELYVSVLPSFLEPKQKLVRAVQNSQFYQA